MPDRRDRLSARRLAHGLSQEQLAGTLNVAADTVSSWERGLRSPSPALRAPLARALDLSTSELDELLTSRQGRWDLPTPRFDSARPSSDEWDAVLEHLADQWHVLVRGDNLLGPSHAVHGVRHHLSLIETLLDQVRGEDWQRVARLGAQYAESAAWLYEDLDDLRSSRHWLTRARQWAHGAGDRDMLVWITYRRSQQAITTGSTHQALDLVLGTTHRPMAKSMSAALLVQQAVAHAALGHTTRTHQALDTAHEHASVDTRGDARYGHGSFCTPSYVELHRAWCQTRLGEPTRAVSLFERHLADLPAVYRRDRGLALARLAHAHLHNAELDQAATRASQALTIARDVGSQRTVAHIQSLASSPAVIQNQHLAPVAELSERLRSW